MTEYEKFIKKIEALGFSKRVPVNVVSSGTHKGSGFWDQFMLKPWDHDELGLRVQIASLPPETIYLSKILVPQVDPDYSFIRPATIRPIAEHPLTEAGILAALQRIREEHRP